MLAGVPSTTPLLAAPSAVIVNAPLVLKVSSPQVPIGQLAGAAVVVGVPVVVVVVP
jgi:hypothetical protein